MLKTLTLTLLCAQLGVNGLEPESFISHMLGNLKEDILHLKPGTNKTYILNSKLLGRNDSIELDIRSRAKHAGKDGMCKESAHEIESHKDNVQDGRGRREHVRNPAKHEAKLKKKRLKLRRHHKLRKAMLTQFEEIRAKNDEKIRHLMKHKQHGGERKKIRIKVVRKHKEDGGPDKVSNKTKGESEGAKPGVKIIKTLRLYHVPRMRLRAKRRRIAAGESQYETPDWDDEGGQIPGLHFGNDYDQEEISAMFRNTKNLEVIERTKQTTTTTTTMKSTTTDLKDEYTYEYVYEDELEKGKALPMKSKQARGDKPKGATSDEYTYEYIYEDEMKKATASPPPSSVTTQSHHTTPAPVTEHTTPTETDEEASDSFQFGHNEYLAEMTGSGVREPVKLSPSVEKEVRGLQALEEKYRTTLDSDILYGDSNSQYKEPARFKQESYEEDYMANSDEPLEYDLFAPLSTTTEKRNLVAESSIMYDDEDTQEFLAKRNQTKRERGWDSHPADMFFTIAYEDFKARYRRPSITPEDYEAYDEAISLWRNNKEHNIGDQVHHPGNETSTRHPFMQTNRLKVTKRRLQHNITINNQVEVNQFNLNEFLLNATNLWMRNVTTQKSSTTSSNLEGQEDEKLVTMDGENLYNIPQYQPYRKLRRYKRDIGGGMKMPRRQYEILMYLFKKVNHTRWIAKLKKMKNAPNLMEMLNRRDKKKTNKHSNRYKLKAIKPKKRPKGPKRVVFKKRMPKEDRRKVRVQLGAKRRRAKTGKKRKRRSVDEFNPNEDVGLNDIVENSKYIDIEALHNIEKRNVDNEFEQDEKANEVMIRNKRAVDKVSDDLLHDFEQMSPEQMQDNEERIAKQTGPTVTPTTNTVTNMTRDMTPKQRSDPRLWMTDSLLREITKRDTMFFHWKYKAKNDTEARVAYMKQRNLCNRLLVKAKNEYTKNLYYMGTELIDERSAVRRMQKKRLNDEMKILLKHLKCPHCRKYYHENATESEEFSLKLTRSPYKYFTRMVQGSNNSTVVLQGKHKIRNDD